jgi:integrase
MPTIVPPMTVEKLKSLKPQRTLYNVGGACGLYLKVERKDAKYFVYRYQSPMTGRQRSMGVGPAAGPNRITLETAREKARELKAVVRTGIDPLEQRDIERAARRAEVQKQAVAAITFSDTAKAYMRAHGATWGYKHSIQWASTLEAYCFPVFGNIAVADIDTSHIMAALEPIWKEKPQTASRLRGRIESVLDYARSRKWRSGENCARWKGHLKSLLAAPRRLAPVQHHDALPWSEIGGLMSTLRLQGDNAGRCLEFIILTAARSGEARGAVWSEIDFDNAVWTIPSHRMKARVAHRVPLSSRALEILRLQKAIGGDLVFPGRGGYTLSGQTLAAAITKAGAEVAVHGFRSTFRDWAGSSTAFPRELAEQALAHTIGNQVEAAYRRDDMLDKRRRLMQSWSDFCDRPTVSADVVPLRAAGVGHD